MHEVFHLIWYALDDVKLEIGAATTGGTAAGRERWGWRALKSSCTEIQEYLIV
jgi:hypothetical protein